MIPARGFRQSMSQLHTWAGLLPGWLLYVIFLFGTVAFFQLEISRWMRPELSGADVTSHALDRVAEHLAETASDAESWRILLPPARAGEAISAFWKARDESGASGQAIFDPVSGMPASIRDTTGGWFPYRFHFQLHYVPRWIGEYLTSLAGLVMLVVILSGVVIHKKIFADFFLLRFGKGQRSWLDTHNVTAVLALPFHLMITYTGLVTLLFTLMPWAITANYETADAFYKARAIPALENEPSGEKAALLPLGALIGSIEHRLGGGRLQFVTISNPGDRSAVIAAWPNRDTLGTFRATSYYSAVTGEQLRSLPKRNASAATQSVMVDLHTGLFAGQMLRWLYFLSGVGGTVMVASGLVLWTVKRRAKLPDPTHPHFGFRLVERLNIGVIVGAPVGIAVYFLANRLLPFDMAQRADWEINSLFIAWGGLFVWTLARPAKRAWVEAFIACAALYALVPLVNALTTERGLIPSLIARDWVFAGFDLVMLVTAAACAFTAWKVATHKPKAAPRRRMRELVEAAA